MSKHRMGGNYSFAKEWPFEDGDTLENTNLFQLVSGTPICSGVKGLIFKCCNLTNCVPPADSVLNDCNIAQINFCSHLHPEWKGLHICSQNCPHVESTDIITIDGVVIETIYHYLDKAI